MIHTPKAIACAIPNFGTFLAHNGLKWSVKQILPPRYILAVLPSSSGNAISGAVAGYVIGIYNIQNDLMIFSILNVMEEIL